MGLRTRQQSVFDMKRITFNSLALAMVILFGTANCSATRGYKLYEGAELPEDRITIITGKERPVFVHAVNGMKNPEGEDTYGSFKMELLPGTHTLTMSFEGRTSTSERADRPYSFYYTVYYRCNSTKRVDIKVNAEAGHTYLVTSKRDFDKHQWYAVVMGEITEETIVQDGPYDLDCVRTGDDREKYLLNLRK